MTKTELLKKNRQRIRHYKFSIRVVQVRRTEYTDMIIDDYKSKIALIKKINEDFKTLP